MIYFVRHGQTDDNINDILTGQNDVPLNQTGIKQAKLAAEELKNVKFDVVYCSLLSRVKNTLNEILKYHKNVKVVFDNRLKERNYGEIQGQVAPPKNIFNRWLITDKIEYKNCESIMDVFLRVSEVYKEIEEKHANQTVLVVAHNGVGRLSQCYFNGFPKSGDLTELSLPNAKAIILKN